MWREGQKHSHETGANGRSITVYKEPPGSPGVAGAPRSLGNPTQRAQGRGELQTAPALSQRHPASQDTCGSCWVRWQTLRPELRTLRTSPREEIHRGPRP